MILSKLYNSLKNLYYRYTKGRWAVERLEQVLSTSEVGATSSDGKVPPILTLKEIDGVVSLMEIVSFIDTVKSQDFKSAVLALPLSDGPLSQETFSKLLTLVTKQTGCQIEALPDSPIRVKSGQHGLSCWRVSW